MVKLFVRLSQDFLVYFQWWVGKVVCGMVKLFVRWQRYSRDGLFVDNFSDQANE